MQDAYLELVKRPAATAEERRRHKRVRLDLAGRFMRADQSEHDCQLVDISLGGARIRTDAPVDPGEKILVNFPDLGTLGGPIFRLLDDGFVVTLDATPRRREKLANQLTWLINRHRFPEDQRRNGHLRVKLANESREIHLPDGQTFQAQVLDISVTGISLQTEQRPQIDTVVTIGRHNARVVRHHETGFAAQFVEVQSPQALRPTGTDR